MLFFNTNWSCLKVNGKHSQRSGDELQYAHKQEAKRHTLFYIKATNCSGY